MGLFRKRFSIIKLILGIVIAGVCLYFLLRGQINYNIVN